MAFTVEDRVTVDGINIILEQKNINRLYDDLYPYAGGNHHYAVYFEDPDKMKIEIVSKE